jgi:hypothetical protein
MDYVPSMAAIAAAGQKSHQAEAVALATAREVSAAAPVALDPRSIYTLSAEAADAVLTLAQAQTRAVEAAAYDTPYGRGPQVGGAVMATAVATTPVVSPESTKSAAAANRNWSEDVRLDHSPSRKVATDVIVQYDNPRVMAAWSAAFPDVAGRKFRGLQLSDTDVRSALSKAALAFNLDDKHRDIYLLCNSEHYKIISADHPDTRFNWINVDSDDILLFWPKDPDRD